MDSSNNLAEIKVNVFELITGKTKIPRSEITLETWVKIIEEVINILKPYLKYLPLSPISELLTEKGGMEYANTKRGEITEEGITIFPEGINPKTHYLLLIDENSFSGKYQLLLTRKGELLIRHTKYEYKEIKGETTNWIEIPTISEFTRITPSEWPEKWQRRDNFQFLALTIIKKLENITNKKRETLAKTLHNIGNAHQKITGILDRISPA
ncbi:hypothetical protein ACFL24_00390 [Patescibacteria group bacterium]